MLRDLMIIIFSGTNLNPSILITSYVHAFDRRILKMVSNVVLKATSFNNLLDQFLIS